MTEKEVLDSLKSVKYPGFTRDIISFGLIKAVKIEGKKVELILEITTADQSIVQQIQREGDAVVRKLGATEVIFHTKVTPPIAAAMQAGAITPAKLGSVKHVIAVASGKGGVGKSTVAANLAAALHQSGLKTGLCDCDLYGPSIGMMFGTDEQPVMEGEDMIRPIEKNGIKLMSMHFLVGDDAPVILRGPMVTRYTQQFLRNVAWGDLDVLILDLPPGTGDIQLTIVQTVALSGAVIVTTPQEVALIDARKAVAMFKKVNVPILGLIENMSYFLCPSDNKRYDIFGTGGGKKEAERQEVPFLGEIPIDIETRAAGDNGLPIVLRDPKNHVSKSFQIVAKTVMQSAGKNL